jgi:DNA-binding HxlR family transcriptional regulator
MTTGHVGSEATAQAQGNAGGSVEEILRLLNGGAAEAILLALDDGPMQTKVLTHRVRGYTARTVYRYLPKLAEFGLVERDDQPSGQAKVVNTLTPEAGRDMCTVVERFARATGTRLPGGQVELGMWGSLGLLADLWDAGVVDALSRGPRSPTELVQDQRGLSYHQVNRKVRQFKEAGFLSERKRSRIRQRSYSLTEKARRTMALIADVSRWRQRHLSDLGEGGRAGGEMATILRVALPLVTLAQHAEKELRIRVLGPSGEVGFGAQLDEEGSVRISEHPIGTPSATVGGDLNAWFSALLDGEHELDVAGDEILVAECLDFLYCRLWTPSPF